MQWQKIKVGGISNCVVQWPRKLPGSGQGSWKSFCLAAGLESSTWWTRVVEKQCAKVILTMDDSVCAVARQERRWARERSGQRLDAVTHSRLHWYIQNKVLYSLFTQTTWGGIEVASSNSDTVWPHLQQLLLRCTLAGFWKTRMWVSALPNSQAFEAYHISSVMSSFSDLNKRFSSIRLFCHVLLNSEKRPMGFRLRLSLNDTPNAIGDIKHLYSWALLTVSEGRWRKDVTSHFRDKTSHSRFDVTQPGSKKCL